MIIANTNTSTSKEVAIHGKINRPFSGALLVLAPDKCAEGGFWFNFMKCQVENCEEDLHAKAYCKKHYMRHHRTGTTDKSSNWSKGPDNCTVYGCQKPHRARGFCINHYKRWKRHGDPEYQRVTRLCSIDNCNSKHSALGYCGRHYTRYKTHGDPFYKKYPSDMCLLKYCDKPRVARGLCEQHYLQSRRLRVINNFGKVCECCGEDRIEFLEIDHVNGDGNVHRREIDRNSGIGFYKWLSANDFEPGVDLRVLCSNCNSSHARYGYCPHQDDRNLRSDIMKALESST